MIHSLFLKTLTLTLFLGILLVAPAKTEAQKPNIILINLDDADAEIFELPYSSSLFPNIMGIAQQGMTFSNLHVTTPLCGPSRASLYRAQYASNTGVCINRPADINANSFQGGFKFYREQGYFNNDLSVWMKNAGYRTMMVGKFLHGDFQRYVPPGWDDFYYYLGGRYFGTFRFTNRNFVNGRTDQLSESTYRTHAESADSTRLIREHVARKNGKPFFLNINPLGPHQAQDDRPEMIEPRMQNWWPNIHQPFSHALNEKNTRDKGGVFRGLPLLSDAREFANLEHFRERALATRSVDDLVGNVQRTLDDLGISDNTYIFVTSDNGFLVGHHRSFGKGVPTDRATRVPCFVVGPNVPVGQKADHLIAHIDIGPTIVKLAQGNVPGFADGISFDRLLKPGGVAALPRFRVGMLIENWSSLNILGMPNRTAASNSVRFSDKVYTEWANGDKDFYDLANDPHQLNNRYDRLPPHEQALYSAWLRALKKNQTPPTARFSNPYFHLQKIEPTAGIRGLAEDRDGIIAVRLAIRDTGNQTYWNGTSWQHEVVQVSAELENEEGQLTVWRYHSMPPNDETTSGKITTWAWAYNRNFDYAPAKPLSFRYDKPDAEQ